MLCSKRRPWESPERDVQRGKPTKIERRKRYFGIGIYVPKGLKTEQDRLLIWTPPGTSGGLDIGYPVFTPTETLLSLNIHRILQLSQITSRYGN